MPRRPLSAYNIFFQEQRALIIGADLKPTDPTNFETKIYPSESDKLGTMKASFVRKKRAHRKTHGKISFADLAKQIGRDWNMLDSHGRERFVAAAAKEKDRYKEELRIYKLKKGDTTGNGPRKEIESPTEATSKSKKPTRSSRSKRDCCYHESGESQSLVNCELEYPQIKDSLTGLTIEYRHNPRQGHTHHSLREGNTNAHHSSVDCFQSDGFHPLPFDTSFDTADLANDRDMVKLVSPLLETRRGAMPPLAGSESYSRHNYYQSHDDVRREREMKRNVYCSPVPSVKRSRYVFGSPVPSIERTGSNTSVLSTEHSGNIPETEVAEFLSAFLGNESKVKKRQSREKNDHVGNAAHTFETYNV